MKKILHLFLLSMFTCLSMFLSADQPDELLDVDVMTLEGCKQARDYVIHRLPDYCKVNNMTTEDILRIMRVRGGLVRLRDISSDNNIPDIIIEQDDQEKTIAITWPTINASSINDDMMSTIRVSTRLLYRIIAGKVSVLSWGSGFFDNIYVSRPKSVRVDENSQCAFGETILSNLTEKISEFVIFKIKEDDFLKMTAEDSIDKKA